MKSTQNFIKFTPFSIPFFYSISLKKKNYANMKTSSLIFKKSSIFNLKNKLCVKNLIWLQIMQIFSHLLLNFKYIFFLWRSKFKSSSHCLDIFFLQIYASFRHIFILYSQDKILTICLWCSVQWKLIGAKLYFFLLVYILEMHHHRFKKNSESEKFFIILFF